MRCLWRRECNELLETFWNNNFAEVIKKFFWNFGKISDFSEGALEKLLGNFELVVIILEKFARKHWTNDNEMFLDQVKISKKFWRTEKFPVNLGHILKKCKEKLLKHLEKLEKVLEIFEKGFEMRKFLKKFGWNFV